jgi:hypothetical protein
MLKLKNCNDIYRHYGMWPGGDHCHTPSCISVQSPILAESLGVMS